MGRRRTKDRHLPQHIYRVRGKYQIRYPNRTTRLFPDLESVLIEWAKAYGDTSSGDISSLIDDYVATALQEKATKTKTEYLSALSRLRAVFGRMEPSSITPAHIYKYMDLQNGKVQANRDKAVLSSVMNLGIRRGLLHANPCKQVQSFTEKPRTRYVTDAELKAVLDIAPPEMRRAMRLCCLTGMRTADLLKGQAHERDGLLITMQKTGRKVLIEWTDELRELAAPFAWSMSGFQSAWQRLMRRAERAGVKRFRFHDLRAKAGSDATDWRLLGHTDRAVFERVYNRKPVRITLDNQQGAE